MELKQGLENYYNQLNNKIWTIKLENFAREVLGLLNEFGTSPNNLALSKIKKFIIEIEAWKADCLQQKIGNAILNTEKNIWNSIYKATNSKDSKDDIQTLLSIMELKGFGSSFDNETGQRRAKVATAVLRFLWLEDWGVIDWRNATLLGLLEQNNWDVDKAINIANNYNANELRSIYDIIDENGAYNFVKIYRKKRSKSLPRAADIDMDLFGISLFIWPFK